MPSIYKFYPIGCSSADESSYHGYLEWNKIVTDKITAVGENSNTSWQQFISSLKDEFGEAVVHDASYLQFPCYRTEISIAQHETEGIHKVRSLCVDLSLLGPFYTCYFQDFYRMHEYTRVNKGRPVVEIALFSTSILNDDELKIRRRATEQLETFFPEFKFYSHYDLLNSKIHADSHPYHDPMSRKRTYSVYDFLMSPVYSGLDIKLLE